MDRDHRSGRCPSALLGVALLLAPLLSGCGGETRKLRELVARAQERHGGRDRFTQTGTYEIVYEIDDFASGEPQSHGVIVRIHGQLVRSEYRSRDRTITTVAPIGGEEGWKKIEDRQGNARFSDLDLPRDVILAEQLAYELDALDVFRLERFLDPPSPDTEVGAKLKVKASYETVPALDHEVLSLDIQELHGETWLPIGFRYVFDSSGKLTRKEKEATLLDANGNPLETVRTEIRYLDYREVGGFLVPHRVEYRVRDSLTQIYRLQAFRPMVYLDESMFLDPRPQIRAAQAAEKAREEAEGKAQDDATPPESGDGS